jgi:hypothetical protein
LLLSDFCSHTGYSDYRAMAANRITRLKVKDSLTKRRFIPNYYMYFLEYNIPFSTKEEELYGQGSIVALHGLQSIHHRSECSSLRIAMFCRDVMPTKGSVSP